MKYFTSTLLVYSLLTTHVFGQRTELIRLRAAVQDYAYQVTQLETDKRLLFERVNILSAVKTNLEDSLSEIIKAKEQLWLEKEKLMGLKMELEGDKSSLLKERDSLAKKSELGSVIHISDVQTMGLRVDKKAKEAKRTFSENIDRLRFKFATNDNYVANSGDELFYFTLYDTKGLPVKLRDGGNGFLKLAGGEEVPYTFIKQIEFKNQSQILNVPLNTRGQLKLNRGMYMVKIYNKGYLSGTSTFFLK